MGLTRRIPFLRRSVWRMATGARNITVTGQMGDGREAAAVDYVLAKSWRSPGERPMLESEFLG